MAAQAESHWRRRVLPLGETPISVVLPGPDDDGRVCSSGFFAGHWVAPCIGIGLHTVSFQEASEQAAQCHGFVFEVQRAGLRGEGGVHAASETGSLITRERRGFLGAQP